MREEKEKGEERKSRARAKSQAKQSLEEKRGYVITVQCFYWLLIVNKHNSCKNSGMAVSLQDIDPSLREQIDVSQYPVSFESEYSDGSIPVMDDFQGALSTGQQPSREEFEGPYGFTLEMDSSKKATNKGSWEYDLRMNKLFIKMGCSVPIQFRVKLTGDELRGMKVRAVLVFDTHDSFVDSVLRCPIHCNPGHKANQDFPHVNHVVRCCHRDAEYETNVQSGRHSVSVPIGEPQPGTTAVTLLYSLMCKSSCEGGINRRNTSIIFTLEKNLQVLGRHVVKVRVCSCPKRDMNSERTALNHDEATDPPKGKKRKLEKPVVCKPEVKQEVCRMPDLPPIVHTNSESLIFLEVHSKRHYKLLLQRAYELYKARAEHNIAMYENLMKQNV